MSKEVNLDDVVSSTIEDKEKPQEEPQEEPKKKRKQIGILIEDPMDFRDLDTRMYQLVASEVRDVLGADASFKNVDMRVYDDVITVYAGAISNILVRVTRGRAFNMGGGHFVWRHTSMTSRRHITKVLQDNKRTKMFFSWPTWSYSSRENGSVSKKR